MNQIILETSAFCVALFCLVDCLRNRRDIYLPLPKGWVNRLKDQHFVYLLVLITLLMSTASSVLEMCMETYFAYGNLFILYLLNESFYIFHNALPFLFALYIINMTGAAGTRDRRFFIGLTVPFALAEIMIFINPLTKLIFYIDSDMKYQRGSALWFMYAIAAFYIIYGVVFFILNIELVSKIDRSAVFILMSIAILGIAIQAVFLITVELFFEAIAFLGFMLLMEDSKFKERTGKFGSMSKGSIVIIAFIFFVVITMNINLIYHAGTDQTGRIGETQINNIKGEMQQAISDSESSLLRYSMGLEQLLGDAATSAETEEYIKQQKQYYVDLSGGNCFNVYAASPEWTIIPDFDMPAEYRAIERVWYTGARKNPGQVFISDPYIDANTGDLCYTFSYMLSDGETVVAMDYSLARVQDIVGRMSATGDQYAMIVTDDGTIVGCTDEAYQGMELKSALPAYADVYQRVKASNEHRSFNTKIDGERMIVFSSETTNGWKLILVVGYSEFYSGILDRMILLGAIDLLMITVIIVFYMVSLNNQRKAERTLVSTEDFILSLSEDLRGPLNDIMKISGMYERQKDASPEALRDIGNAGRRLGEKMDNLFSFSKILKTYGTGTSDERTRRRRRASISSRYMRNGIISILIASLLIGLIMCISITTNWGTLRIGRKADRYNSEVALWMQQKQSILRMFSDVIAAGPEVLDDYDHAVGWLDEITRNYSDMTFAYLANPYNTEHQIIMNNGWVPDSDYKVEERQWYKDTERSGDGFSISAPYFDAQTGLYCVTFSRTVFSPDGEFLGIFAIDCLLDKLIDVLDDSYDPEGYAFLVDRDGNIINHPNKEYEMSPESVVNIEDTGYADVYHSGSSSWLWDYDGRLVACRCEKSNLSGFSVVVVQSWWSIYGLVFLMGLIFIVMLAASIIAVVRMINRFIGWQEETNEKLVDAANTAVAAEKAKSRFLAQMSHEIRTPINTVLGMNEMILRESSDDMIRGYASNIQGAGRNLLGLINSILDFSKIEEGKMEIIPVRYDTASMIENIVNSVVKRAADKGLVFEAHVDRDLPSVLYGDDMRVSQVAVNLLTNAVKYTPEGRVDLYIEKAAVEGRNVDLRMRIKDTGIGIKEEDIGKLFESFTRLEETRNRSIEGTGLGMAIVNRLLDMMDSKLEVESVYGEGSEFAFTVRQEVIDEQPIGDYEIKAREALEPENDDSYLYAPSARLLIVDDNSMNLMVISNLLKLNGIRPDLADSGARALEILSENTYDVIMLDHMMPQMDGIETLRKAREAGLIPEGCAVIALTANAVVGAKESYLRSGFDDYLSKPVDVAEMESVLARHLPADMVGYRSRSEAAGAADANAAKTVPQDSERELMDALSGLGIDTETGLKYCGGDVNFYKEVLAEYCSTSDERISELETAAAENDMKTYGIKVHSLKSISRTIGAAALADTALSLEKAAKAGDAETVMLGHKGLMDDFAKLTEEISRTGSFREVSSGSDDEILEFGPE